MGYPLMPMVDAAGRRRLCPQAVSAGLCCFSAILPHCLQTSIKFPQEEWQGLTHTPGI